jgi:hypothetical protein
MNNPTQLDSFETALLTELRREVAERPTPAPVPAVVRRPKRRLRLAAAAATGVAASVVAVFGLGGSGGSPAYAVDENNAGDVTVTVRRLDDAAGLEAALKARGIDATVRYDADGLGTPSELGADGDAAPSADSAGASFPNEYDVPDNSGQVDQAGPALQSETGPDLCGLGTDPATLSRQGSDWVLRIPSDSPLHSRHVDIGTDADGALSVLYEGTQPGSTCSLLSL